jgi:hypothetical protein
MRRSVFTRLAPRALVATTLATLATLATTSVHAIPPRGPDPFSHDKGFFMRGAAPAAPTSRCPVLRPSSISPSAASSPQIWR